jgi:putative glutamine amidotransferase
MTDRRPLIAISTYVERARWSLWDIEAALVPQLFVDAVQKAGGVAMLLPPDESFDDGGAREVLGAVDGLLLTGGPDVDASLYGAEPAPEHEGSRIERDRSELALIKTAIEIDLPLLAVCRGMQLLNVARGGTLIQDLPRYHRPNPGSLEGSEHDVRLADGSLAAAVTGELLHSAMQHHHQGVDRIGDGLTVTGWAVEDDFPEAIEMNDRRFVLGVQWHPEGDATSPVIGSFVRACADRL